MLFPEIEPYADAHIQKIEEMQKEIRSLFYQTDDVDLADKLDRWEEELAQLRKGFTRFKICMADTFKEKERLHGKWLNCRLNHTDIRKVSS